MSGSRPRPRVIPMHGENALRSSRRWRRFVESGIGYVASPSVARGGSRPRADRDVGLHTSRRWVCAFFQCLLTTLVAVTLLSASAVAMDSAITNIHVRQTEDGYVVDLVSWVRVPRELAFEVLVDFDHMANWVPNVRESRVLKREVNSATIEYRGLVTVGFLAFPFTTVRDIEFRPPTWIHTTQVGGTMKRHESQLNVVAEGTGTRLDYRVEMAPDFMTAIVMNRGRVEREVVKHFEAINAEMLRRRDATAPSTP